MIKIAGIDNSKNSPGVVKFTIDDDFKIIKEEYLGLVINKNKKPMQLNDNCLVLENFKINLNDYDKINFMSSNIIEFVSDCNYVAFEDYAYSGSGAVFDIAEATGVLKYLLYNKNIFLRFYAPTLIKMFGTTNGGADKTLVIETYKKLGNPLNIPNSHLKEKDHPFEDIVDAYFITKLLYTELAIRKGFIHLHELSEQEIRPFNHISKSSKVNLLSLDFIQKKIG